LKMGELNFSWLIPGEIAGHRAPISEEDLRYLKHKGIKALVRMSEHHKAKVTGDQIEKLGFTDCHKPVPDFTAPSQEQIDKIIAFIKQSTANKKPVGVSCSAGIGRTGTILACYLVIKGWTTDKAIREVRSKRPGSIETPEQEEAIRLFADSQ